jgi:hypothetical protein
MTREERGRLREELVRAESELRRLVRNDGTGSSLMYTQGILDALRWAVGETRVAPVPRRRASRDDKGGT